MISIHEGGVLYALATHKLVKINELRILMQAELYLHISEDEKHGAYLRKKK
jgi:hypothetical protein